MDLTRDEYRILLAEAAKDLASAALAPNWSIKTYDLHRKYQRVGEFLRALSPMPPPLSDMDEPIDADTFREMVKMAKL